MAVFLLSKAAIFTKPLRKFAGDISIISYTFIYVSFN